MLIGELSSRSGFSRDTIRYYEKLGLIALSPGRRSANGYKNYPLEILERLRQIEHLKKVGFALREIQLLLVRDGKHNGCLGLPKRLTEKLSRLDDQIEKLLEFKASLSQILRACDGNCSNDKGMPGCIPVDAGRQSSRCC